MSYPVYWCKVGDTLPILFGSYDGGTGASITLTGLATSDIEIYKDGSNTTRASDSGYALLGTDGIDEFGTGIHGVSVDLSDNTDAGFYAAGSWFHVVIASVTIDSQTVNFVAAAFYIEPDAGVKAVSDVHSLVTKVYSDTALIDSGVDVVQSDTAVIETTAAADYSRLQVVEAAIDSDQTSRATALANIDSQATATDSQLTVTDGVVAQDYSRLQVVEAAIDSDQTSRATALANIDSQATATDSQLTVTDGVVAQDYSRLQVVEAAIDSDQTSRATALANIDSQATATDSQLTVTDGVVAQDYSRLQVVETAIDSDQTSRATALANIDSQATATKSQLVVVASDLVSIQQGYVESTTKAGTLSTTQSSTNLTEATDDHYIGRLIVFIDGVCAGQASDITDYTGVNGVLTYTAMTEAAGAGDTFRIY